MMYVHVYLYKYAILMSDSGHGSKFLFYNHQDMAQVMSSSLVSISCSEIDALTTYDWPGTSVSREKSDVTAASALESDLGACELEPDVECVIMPDGVMTTADSPMAWCTLPVTSLTRKACCCMSSIVLA